MSAKVQVIFYSTYGHVWHLAEAVAEGARAVAGSDVQVLQVAETLPADVLEKMGATEARKAFAHVPVADPRRLAEADGIILGTPTRYGAATAQMRAFLDNTGGLWVSGALIGKVGSAFTSTASQHGGQETTLLTLSTFFFHMGMVIAGVPAVQLAGTARAGRGKRRHALRGVHHRRTPGRAAADGKRAGHRPRSGAARRADRGQIGDEVTEAAASRGLALRGRLRVCQGQ